MSNSSDTRKIGRDVKLKVVVDTAELDEALRKCTELHNLLTKLAAEGVSVNIKGHCADVHDKPCSDVNE